MISFKKMYHRVMPISSLASMIRRKAKYHRFVTRISILDSMIPLIEKHHKVVARRSILASMILLTERYHKVMARNRSLARSSLASTRRRPGAGPLEPDAPITASLGSPATKYTVMFNNNNNFDEC